MFKKIKQLVVLAFVTTLAVVLFPSLAQASELNFSVNPQMPSNQTDPKLGYYDLLVQPGQQEDIIAQVSNSTNRTVKVRVKVNPAFTNTNGVVQYDTFVKKLDPTLKYNIRHYVQYPHVVTLTPNSKQDLHIHVKSPARKFKGLIAGGISFKEINAPQKNKASKGVSIKNEFSYVVALVMQQTPDAGHKMKPDLKLHKVYPDLVNYRNAIKVNLQNPKPVYLNNLLVKAKITAKRGSTSYTAKKVNMQMAPNSNFDFPFDLSGQRLSSGKYHLHLVAYGQKTPQGKYVIGEQERYSRKWVFDKDFRITLKQARYGNQNDLIIKSQKRSIWFYVALILLLLLLLLLIIAIIVWLYKRNQKKKAAEQGESSNSHVKK